MNITLFGGAFNPPHLGHLIVIHQALELIPGIDELWILPCYQHTFLKDLAPANHRLEMSRFLVGNLSPDIKSRVRTCPIEIEKKLSGETYEALQKLRSERAYLQHAMNLLDHDSSFILHYSFLMGTDQLKNFKKWGNWEKLLKEMPFYIYPRAGFRNSLTFPNMTLLKSDTQVITNISSTLIRERIKKGLPIAHLLPASVLKYLRVNKLY
ncbi:MAG: nicotinate (nicotinamide) nucleotide adenylyltransferase [Candidatus Chisholmbacteria bacterium RIFCSPHIGHO2_01_FULL_49_18]|uniref:Probable nicotinate-nucleotide adenylyltransferase n=2 Tax=Candidatus Chisholmiibacteriota TaxID=1817900 RepID=A0A1G1VMX7_9BACT|nr:MAG: nicotinate (nicotinamide) nucleotide adenylyltransferase [Candidatus Chisholmbacteria bacterium RIFCSPHIGHO2_01_FULL_49_18]OGY21350.1 MAG: nicotinate (nicotinamide) nucleotide adenylyltransferase [Candidatus Chisholmbacteria bacterium RIFCSPLOWO2_01_FULL_49_14]